MIKLVAMLLYVVVGALIGGLFYRANGHKKLTLPQCLILGVIGAFGGLLLADLADLRIVGNLIDSLIFSSIGSALLLWLNFVLSQRK